MDVTIDEAEFDLRWEEVDLMQISLITKDQLINEHCIIIREK